MSIPLIHIGYHKCASSYLQRSFFWVDEERFFDLGKSNANTYLIAPHPLEFDAHFTREIFDRRLQEKPPGDRQLVLSSERLSGNPHLGGGDSLIIADRIKEVFPNARILIIIREQVAVIASNYGQYVRQGGRMSLRRYLVPPKYIIPGPGFSFINFEYHRLIGYYHELFGRSNVLVLPFEELRRDPGEFVNRVLRFGDVVELEKPPEKMLNRSLCYITLNLKRNFNWLFTQRYNSKGAIDCRKAGEKFEAILYNADQLMPRGVRQLGADRLRRKVARIVGDRYAESNRRTSELIEVKLEALGYTSVKEILKCV